MDKKIYVRQSYLGYQFCIEDEKGAGYVIASYKTATNKVEFNSYYQFSPEEIESILKFLKEKK